MTRHRKVLSSAGAGTRKWCEEEADRILSADAGMSLRAYKNKMIRETISAGSVSLDDGTNDDSGPLSECTSIEDLNPFIAARAEKESEELDIRDRINALIGLLPADVRSTLSRLGKDTKDMLIQLGFATSTRNQQMILADALETIEEAVKAGATVAQAAYLSRKLISRFDTHGVLHRQGDLFEREAA